MADSSGSPVVKKSKKATVTDIGAARGRGKPAGRGYDPLTGEEIEPTRDEPALPEHVDRRGSQAEFDVFALVDSSKYRHDRFYTRSVDRHGHRESMRIAMPQGIDSQIYAAVANVPFYNSPQDFFRDAAVHRLEWLQHHFDLDDSVRRMAELERFLADSDRRAQEIAQMQAAVADIETKLEECYRAEDWQMFALELVEGTERAEWLREPYQARALKIIQGWRERGSAQLTKLREQGE